MNIQKAENRGKSDLEWLQSNFSFSFANYYDENRMGFGKLRVVNDDTVAPGKGFETHSHSNMEIISIPLEGELAHKDSEGNEEVITPGMIQVMSAGSGIKHSEYNHSKENQLKFFQIWIETKEQNIKPRHDSKNLDLKENEFVEIVSGDKKIESLHIHQDAKISIGTFNKEKKIILKPGNKKGIFLMVIKGSVTVNGHILNDRDSVETTDQIKINIVPTAQLITIEVPMN